MKRKAAYSHWFWSAYDQTKMEPGLLEAVGHLTFLWNDIEEALDRAFMWSTESPMALQIEIRSRINGLDGKIEIIKAAVGKREGLPEIQRAATLATLGALQGFKERRDAVIHARASEIFNGVARTFERRGAVYEVLLTTDAVRQLNAHLEIYQAEIDALGGLVIGFLPMASAMRAPLLKAVNEFLKAQGRSQVSGTLEQEYLAKFLNCQHRRRALPALPEFPMEARVPEVTLQTL